MMTIVTHVELKPGTESEWDRAMQERLHAAENREGWVAGQLLRPVDQPHQRVIVGTWRSREHWETWHRDPAFRETRTRLAPTIRECTRRRTEGLQRVRG